MGRHISASLGPVLAGLLNLLSFDDAPDPLGVLMLVLRKLSFLKFWHMIFPGQIIQTADGAKKFSKTCFLKPNGAENFFK